MVVVITLRTLLDEMADLGRLAEFPDPYYKEAQSSSYDRASKEPGTPDWFANRDHSYYIRTQARDGETECVLMEADGPGAIVRIWSASAEKGGTLRVYIDGDPEPALEYNMRDLMEGKHPAFPEPLAGYRGCGWNLYYPIPYGKHCMVTATATPAFYYHVNYRTYASGTAVESFTMDLADAASDKAIEIAARLASPADPPVTEADCIPVDMEIAPGGPHTIAAIAGPKAIRLLKLGLDLPADKSLTDRRFEARRRCVLRIRFDGERQPAVEAPIGDFFGSAPGVNAYNSLPLAVEVDGAMTSRWLMPFAESAKIEIQNYDSDPIRLTGRIYTAAYEWGPKSLHFHARWRLEREIPTDPPIDWNLLDAVGRGRYVGNMLTLVNPSMIWWGEGDEKVYIDGETFPSTFGTGTEDYYCYGYGSTDEFHHAYHNQPICDEPPSFGIVCVNRFHIFDDIPFTKSLRFDLEVWHWDRRIKIDYATTVYWYAGPGARSTFAPLTADSTPIIGRPTLFRIEDAIEAEDLETEVSGGRSWSEVAGIEYSAGHVSLWKEMRPGDTKTFRLPVQKAGRYRIIGIFDSDPGHGIYTATPARGVCDVSVNGVEGARGLDLSGVGLAHPRQADLGIYDLQEGKNDLVFTCRSEPEGRTPNLLVVDCLRLLRAG
jgi:hypothetical protein